MPKLVFSDSQGVEKVIDLGAEPVLIGRAVEAHVHTNDAAVSRRHASLRWDGGSYVIEDLGSANGVYVCGERVKQAAVRPGDEVKCGSLLLRLLPDTSQRAAAAQRVSTEPSPTTPPPSAPPPAPLVPSTASMLQTARDRSGGDTAALVDAEQKIARLESKLAEARERIAELEHAPAPPRDAGFAEERAALQRRIAELEQAPRGGGGDADTARLSRKIEQLTADIRRLRGGTPPAALDQARIQELELRVVELERGALPQDAPSSSAGGADPRLAELQERLGRAEQERDALRRAASTASAPAVGSPGPSSAVVAETASAISDVLGDLKSSLRAAREEVEALGAAAGDSGVVLRDAITAASEALENARAHARTLLGQVGR